MDLPTKKKGKETSVQQKRKINVSTTVSKDVTSEVSEPVCEKASLYGERKWQRKSSRKWRIREMPPEDKKNSDSSLCLESPEGLPS